MQKKWIALGMILSATTSAQPSYVQNCAGYDVLPYNGFYVGLGLGSNIINYKTNIYETSTLVNTDIFGQGAFGNILFGYSTKYNDWWGLDFEAFGYYTSQQTDSIGVYGPGGSLSNMQFLNTWNVGLSVLPGYYVSRNTMVFVRLGAVNSFFLTKVTGVSDSRASANLWGGETGVGLEMRLPKTDHLSLRGEYDYIFYQPWNSIGNFSCGAGCTNNANIKLNYNLVQLNLIYHFN